EVPDWVLVPGGNLGNVSAIAKGFFQMRELGLIDRVPRLVCCQAAKNNPLYLAYQRAKAAGRPLAEGDFEPITAGDTLASAIRIGAPVSISKAVRALGASNVVVEQATDAELADAAARADRTGMFNCPHTGVALACLEKLVARGEIKKDERVIVISTAHGLKFTEFKAAYHGARMPFDAKYANRPLELGADPKDVLAGIHRAIDAMDVGCN
ncbi:MAG: pyridoxal-phosphate dependent enzyme, partial [Myxococcales bacterium]|nr:pyridoxal-phosphate dependent enzyme [Myxococcales bacterium]